MKFKKEPEMNRREILRRYGIPSPVIIQVDDREKLPILFPKTMTIVHPENCGEQLTIPVEVESVRLDAGDYRLKAYPSECIIERKGSQLELYKNLFSPRDSIRQARAFRKLKGACRHPILLVECSPRDLMVKHTRKYLTQRIGIYIPEPELVVHRLTLIVRKYGFDLMFLPWPTSPSGRRLNGSVVLHTLLSAALYHNYDQLPELRLPEEFMDILGKKG